MRRKHTALITSAGGHGFMELLFAKTYNMKEVVACSEKTTKEEFEKETEDIYNRLSPFFPNMKKASWDKSKKLLKEGVSYRKKILTKKISGAMWKTFAKHKLNPKRRKNLPKFEGVDDKSFKVMLIPQKLFSDGLCGVSAKQQSVPLEAFGFFKYEDDVFAILGQHFHKVNDLEHVENIAKEFSMYVPGKTEHEEVFGIRGVNHDQYLGLYDKVDMAVGIAGTHTWYMLTCYPDIPQIILYNKKGVENWDKIAKAYQKEGREVYALGFDENTDWKKFSLELKALYTKVSKKVQKTKKAEKTKKVPQDMKIRRAVACR